MTYEELRPGCYDPVARVEDNELNHVTASLCFPTFPRFCGQTFTEAADHELGLACVKADNDWMVDSASTSAAVMAGRGALDEPVDAAREARGRQRDDIGIRHLVGRDRDGRCIGARRRGRPRRHDGQAEASTSSPTTNDLRSGVAMIPPVRPPPPRRS